MEPKRATVQRIEPTLVRALIDAPCLARSAVVHPWLKLPMQPPWHHQAHPCSSPAQASQPALSILVVEKAGKAGREEGRSHIWPWAARLNRRDLIRTLPDALKSALPFPVPSVALPAIRLLTQSHCLPSRVLDKNRSQGLGPFSLLSSPHMVYTVHLAVNILQ